jgi:hypothetical protein
LKKRILPDRATRKDDIVAFLRLVVEPDDLFRLVLQVAVHHDHPVAPGMVQPRRDRPDLPEVSGQVEALDARVFQGDLLDDLPGILGAGIIDKDDLVVLSDRCQR